MKKTLAFTLILSALSPSISASDTIKAPIAVEYNFTGYTPWGFESLRINRDGSVITIRGGRNGPKRQRAVAQLSRDQVESLFKEVEKFPKEELIDLNPDVKNCPSDVPHELYTILSKDETLLFAEHRSDCHKLILKNYYYESLMMKRIIDGLLTLARFGW